MKKKSKSAATLLTLKPTKFLQHPQKRMNFLVIEDSFQNLYQFTNKMRNAIKIYDNFESIRYKKKNLQY